MTKPGRGPGETAKQPSLSLPAQACDRHFHIYGSYDGPPLGYGSGAVQRRALPMRISGRPARSLWCPAWLASVCRRDGVSTRCYGMDRRSFLSLVAGCVTWPSIAHAVSRPPIALRRLRLVNAHTGETFDGAYRDDKGRSKESSTSSAFFSATIIPGKRRRSMSG